nr:hypothetical protein [Tanacetum cinerariifolium]
MKEKGDQCILVGYSTQSKGYRVYNKRTRMIVDSIHIRFDEIKEETSVANNTSGLIPKRQKASDSDNPDPVPQRQDVYSSVDADVPSQQELDLLFGPLYDEFFNAEIVDNAWIKHSKDQFRAPTAQDIEIIIQTCLMPLTIKTQNDSFIFVHELKQEMHDDLKYVESLEKETDKLESDKAGFSNMYDMILQECMSNDVMCSYFLSLFDLDALAELQCLYLHKVKECDCFAQKLSKQTEYVIKEVHTELLQHFAKVEKHSISLEIALQKCKEQVKNDTIWNEQASNVFQKEREQYIEIQDLKAQLQDKNISIITAQTLPQTARQAVSNTDVLKPEMYRIDNRTTQTRVPQSPQTVKNTNPRVSTSTGVDHKNNVSRIPHRSNQLKDKVIVQLIIFIVEFGCTKHMAGNLKLLCNLVEQFLGTIHFGNDQFAPILGYGDLVAFLKSTCFVRDLQGNDLLIDNSGSDLYIIFLQESTSSTPLCLIAKASPTQAWLWHRRLSHLNFDYINLLSKKDVVIGLPKLKYVKDQLCSSCELSKAKRSSFKSKVVPCLKERLNLLHMDLCGPMWVTSINGKKYILVIVDDYSRYTWTLFLRSKDETPEVLKEFLSMIQRNLQASVITVQTDRGTEFLNKTLNAFFKEEGIKHQNFTARTPEQNDVVER